jgi:hypothetical protein
LELFDSSLEEGFVGLESGSFWDTIVVFTGKKTGLEG